jgi:hypothetical protein
LIDKQAVFRRTRPIITWGVVVSRPANQKSSLPIPEKQKEKPEKKVPSQSAPPPFTPGHAIQTEPVIRPPSGHQSNIKKAQITNKHGLPLVCFQDFTHKASLVTYIMTQTWPVTGSCRNELDCFGCGSMLTGYPHWTLWTTCAPCNLLTSRSVVLSGMVWRYRRR